MAAYHQVLVLRRDGPSVTHNYPDTQEAMACVRNLVAEWEAEGLTVLKQKPGFSYIAQWGDSAPLREVRLTIWDDERCLWW